MSSTATVCTIIIMRICMHKWSESIQRKSNPYGVANAEYVQRAVKEHVAVSHRRKPDESRSIRPAYVK